MRHNIATLAHAFVNDEELVTAMANSNFYLRHSDFSRQPEVWAQLDSYATCIAERHSDKVTFGVNRYHYGSSFTGRHRRAVIACLEEAGYVKTDETYERSVWYMHHREVAIFDVYRKAE